MLASKKEPHVDRKVCSGEGRGKLKMESRRKEVKVTQLRHCHRGRSTEENTTLNTV